MSGNRMRLLSLSEREFQRETRVQPQVRPQRKFKGLNLNVSKFDSSWDRKRGSAVRLMAVLVRENDDALFQRVTADDKVVATYRDVEDWLGREGAYLRKMARLLETASSRLSVVLERFDQQVSKAVA